MTIKLTQNENINFIQSGSSTESNSTADLRFTNFSTTGTTLMTITTAGNVGIGTTSPSRTLDVTGTINATTYTGGSVQVTNITTNSLIAGSARLSSISIIGTLGNVVSIGSTMASSSSRIEVVSGASEMIRLTSVLGAPHINFYNSDQSARTFIGMDGSALLNNVQNAGIVGTRTNHPFLFATNNTERMRLNTAGNLGIGTTNPGYTLDVNGTFDASNSNGVMLFNSAGNLGIGTTSPSTTLSIRGNSTGGILKISNNTENVNDNFWIGFNHGNTGADSVDRARIGITIANGGGGRLFFTTGTSGSQTERMRIDENGNLGIGTTAPAYKLDIDGGSSGACIRIRSTDANVTYIDLDSSANTGGKNWRLLSSHGTAGEGQGKFIIQLAGVSNMVTVTTAGSLGVGTVSPGYRLDVQGGDINASGSVRSNGTALTSDQRVKENIVDADTSDNLSHILSLELKHYDYTQAFVEHTGRPDESNYGFIAQQVKEVIPNAVDIQHITLQKDIITQVPVLDEEGNPKLDEQGNEVIVNKKERIVVQDIPDFHFLKKDLIYTEAVGAIQELYKQLQNLKQEFDQYKQTHP